MLQEAEKPFKWGNVLEYPSQGTQEQQYRDNGNEVEADADEKYSKGVEFEQCYTNGDTAPEFKYWYH